MKSFKFINSLAMAIIGGLISLGIYSQFNNFNQTNSFQNGITPAKLASLLGDNPSGLPDFRLAAESSVHAVVHIKTSYQQTVSSYNDFFGADPFQDFFFGNPFGRPQIQPQQPQTKQVQASGSGVIISADGYIVTNNHVIENADQIEVVMNDKRIFTAKIIGTDPSTDIALLKVEEKGLPYLTYGNSDSVAVGEWVLAVGNPFNLTSTVTAGIVSAKARNINILGGGANIESFIQTDAAVNPGNSGGALINTSGELIGINTAIASNTGSYAGYSFAIPVTIVKKVVDDLLNYGEVQRAFIGVSIIDIDSKIAKEKGLDDIKGVFVQSLNENGAAADAGIKEGDVITSINGIETNSSAVLLEIVGRNRPGDQISVVIKRNGKSQTIPIVLKNKYGDTGIVKNEKENTISLSALGATFETITKEEKAKLKIENGVRISDITSGKLSNIGIRKGFIVTHIDKKPVKSPEEIKEILSGKTGGVLIEGVYPNGMRAYYAFGL